MPNLRVPEGAQDSLILLTQLSNEAMKSLKEVLRKASPTLSVAELAKKIAPQVALAPEQIVRLITVLGSLYAARAEQNVSPEKFSQSFLAAVKQTGNKGLQLKPNALARFKRDVEDLLSLDSLLGVAGRALDVMHEHEHVFLSSRVLSDLRPVFISEPIGTPSGFVLIHNLKIAYRAGGRNLEFFVAMDSTDLRGLQKTLERAVKKEESLKSLTESAGIPCLYSEGE